MGFSTNMRMLNKLNVKHVLLMMMMMTAMQVMKEAHPGQAFVLLSLRVLQPLHQFSVSEQVSVQRAVFGQGQLCCVLSQC